MKQCSVQTRVVERMTNNSTVKKLALLAAVFFKKASDFFYDAADTNDNTAEKIYSSNAVAKSELNGISFYPKEWAKKIAKAGNIEWFKFSRNQVSSKTVHPQISKKINKTEISDSVTYENINKKPGQVDKVKNNGKDKEKSNFFNRETKIWESIETRNTASKCIDSEDTTVSEFNNKKLRPAAKDSIEITKKTLRVSSNAEEIYEKPVHINKELFLTDLLPEEALKKTKTKKTPDYIEKKNHRKSKPGHINFESDNAEKKIAGKWPIISKSIENEHETVYSPTTVKNLQWADKESKTLNPPLFANKAQIKEKKPNEIENSILKKSLYVETNGAISRNNTLLNSNILTEEKKSTNSESKKIKLSKRGSWPHLPDLNLDTKLHLPDFKENERIRFLEKEQKGGLWNVLRF